ncbi:hypothetical protein GCM10027570_08850 [Streptomonospora sediminis]
MGGSWAHTSGGPPALMLHRPAPSGGGLYPIEAYAAQVGALSHYAPAHHVLEVLNGGDHRPAVTAALADPPREPADVHLLLSAVFWRQGFKYGDFAYRLQCQEIGALITQARAVAERDGIVVRAHLRFDDGAVARLLGLDPEAEGVLAVLSLTGGRIGECTDTDAGADTDTDGTADTAADTGTKSSTSTNTNTNTNTATGGGTATDTGTRSAVEPAAQPRPAAPPVPVTGRLPHLAALHARAAAAARAPACTVPACAVGRTAEPQRVPVPLPAVAPPVQAAGIGARRSTPRGYRPDPVAAAEVARILAAAWAAGADDIPGARDRPCTLELYLVALRTTGLAAGGYRYRGGWHAVEPVGAAGDIGPAIARGPLTANARAALRGAAAVLIPVGDQLAGSTEFGARWYRIQQAETGMALHRAALAAPPLGLSARIHSDGTNAVTEAALGLAGTGRTPLGFLLIGVPATGGPVLDGRLALSTGTAGGDGRRPSAASAASCQ